jgi:outer membrane protein
LAATRAAYWPSLTLEARYLRAEGGRTIEFPIGDALNPAYQTLNRLTAGSANPTQFPSVANQEFELLREREQDSRLKLALPIYAPQLDAALAASAAREADALAARESFARVLVRDVRRAFNAVAQARQFEQTLQSSKLVLLENLRVNEALFKSGSVTRDKTLRAQAEALAIDDRLESNHNQIKSASRYLNYLSARPIDAPVSIIDEDEPTSAALLGLLQQSQDKFVARPELKRLDAGIALASADQQRAKALRLPNLSFGADLGIQGEDYAFGSNQNFATAAIVLNWRLFDFGQTRAQIRSANAQIEAVKAERLALLERLQLAALQAREEAESAARRVQSAGARLSAADESFRIMARKRDAGTATQLEFLDAERAKTEANLALSLSRFEQANQLAELELALAAYPLQMEQGP